jgi:hypothetical protein
MRYSFFLLFATLYIVGCNNSPKTQESSSTEVATPAAPAQSKLNEAGTQKLMSLVTGYYELKNAMVATNATKADDAAKKLLISADTMQAFLQNDSMNKTALQPYIDTIIKSSNEILALKDETCEKKRTHFETVSSAMYGMLKKADLKNVKIYREYCPMAFNDKGAYWLSADAEIKNPYFGKKMLECGEVTDSL